ncbi:ABC transporter related protein [Bacteroides coprosuis DSM 18011]|uniref:ABC transporter related protein n=1 Tax=Bacteroides coprosuis DSM 18011 TaxID=679937 RepID=F3ZNR7_9BACE|nr:ATP-binding cassette domain-containing protein [Bacteroides coprosuis]EGJ70256.1 ABC transporter related protein [Bacteroides coprosuis DSM 18011]
MEKIHLKQALPEVFAGGSSIQSDIWHQDIIFDKEMICLIKAASGTGKSSLCSYIFGYRRDYQGMIFFDDVNIKQIKSKDWNSIRQKELSIMFQELRLFEELTALENIQIKNKLTKFKSKKDITNMLERLGIADKTNIPIKALSFGQRQRVAFIRALCQPYQFILLDEPISHLDVENSKELAKLLLEEASGQGAGIIVTSLGHQLDLPYSNYFNL